MIESGASPKRVKAASGYPFIFAGGKSWLEGLSVDLENLQALLPRPVPSAPSVPRRETSGLAKGDQNSAGHFFFERIQRSRRFRWVTVVFIHVYIYIYLSLLAKGLYIYIRTSLCLNQYIHTYLYIYIYMYRYVLYMFTLGPSIWVWFNVVWSLQKDDGWKRKQTVHLQHGHISPVDEFSKGERH